MKYVIMNHGTITNGQSRETGNIGYTRQRQTKQRHSTICDGHHYSQTNTNNVNKTWTIIQTTEGIDEPNNYQLIINISNGYELCSMSSICIRAYLKKLVRQSKCTIDHLDSVF